MSSASIFFVGQPHEVAHHAAPFRERLNLRIAEPAKVLEQACPGDLAIFYSEHFERFRECCQQLKSRNVATLYMIDGILEWRNAWENQPDEVACPYTMRPALAHKVACIGHSQARILDGWGNVGKTEIVGIPRLDHFYDPSAPIPAVDSDKEDLKNDSNDFRVLVMTAKTPGFTPEQIQRATQSLLDIKTWHRENPTLGRRKVELVWRLTGGLAEQIEVENRLGDLSGGELKEILNDVDAVVTTPSTAMLESMLMNLPVAVLDYHNCPQYVTGGWDICAAEHIDIAMRQMSNRNEARMLFQNNELQDSLHCSSSATDRFVELAESMLAMAKHQIAAGAALEFPAKMLSNSPIRLTDFSHDRLYPNAQEFLVTDKTELQVQLSHARREVAQLQRKLNQAQSTLDEAHAILEQIEQHPIAGPIVRLRKRFKDWIAAFRNRCSDHEAMRNSSEQLRQKDTL